MSPESEIACPPAALTCATVSTAASALRSATATRAPRRATARAVAPPLSPPPPVISADFPSSIPAIASSLGYPNRDHGTAEASPGIAKHHRGGPREVMVLP